MFSTLHNMIGVGGAVIRTARSRNTDQRTTPLDAQLPLLGALSERFCAQRPSHADSSPQLLPFHHFTRIV
jgi:hypothetical protein